MLNSNTRLKLLINHGPESDLVYDPQATQRAYREVVEFLDTLPRNGTDAVAR